MKAFKIEVTSEVSFYITCFLPASVSNNDSGNVLEIAL